MLNMLAISRGNTANFLRDAGFLVGVHFLARRLKYWQVELMKRLALSSIAAARLGQ